MLIKRLCAVALLSSLISVTDVLGDDNKKKDEKKVQAEEANSEEANTDEQSSENTNSDEQTPASSEEELTKKLQLQLALKK